MSERHHVFLVPGFFGFANLGDLSYWGHVVRLLQAVLGQAGVEAVLHPVVTEPTASLSTRAARLHDAIAAADDRGPIHLVGHSTGGLDARLCVTPGAELPGGRNPGIYAHRVRSVVGISVPHHGTPLAAMFNTLQGKQLLRLLSIATLLVVRRGALPVSLLARLAAAAQRLVRGEGSGAMVDELTDSLLASFTPERRAEVTRFFDDVGRDQRLLTQLTTDAMDAFNAATPDRPDVRYGNVVTRARAPELLDSVRAGLDPTAHAEAILWRVLHAAAGRTDPALLPPPSNGQADVFRRDLGAVPTAADSDGMVPTLSQVRGALIAAVRADHLDILGHFGDATLHPPHYDWIRTGTGFGWTAFENTWRRVARFMVPEVAPVT
ncbi:MAG: triacylglycerol lipase [Alphaproteobacteria bacterium]|nr:triacylglycerol lipase [Alphaproteobacteria bacterium]